MTKTIERWRRVWRDGIAPQLSTAGLEALRSALITDDERLIQGLVFDGYYNKDVVNKGCAIGLCGMADGLVLKEEILDFYNNIIDRSDYSLDEPASSRFFIGWFDANPREEVRRELLPEVERVLEGRRKKVVVT